MRLHIALSNDLALHVLLLLGYSRDPILTHLIILHLIKLFLLLRLLILLDHVVLLLLVLLALHLVVLIVGVGEPGLDAVVRLRGNAATALHHHVRVVIQALR